MSMTKPDEVLPDLSRGARPKMSFGVASLLIAGLLRFGCDEA